jgi:hypothetical protein
MRPHVEFIDQQDLLWHMAEFPLAVGEAKQRNLSYDEEDGSASLRVDFVSDWSRPAGLHNAVTEWYVLKGKVTIGDDVLGEGGYWHAAKGILTPAIKVEVGTEILLFREYGDWGFQVSDSNGPEKRDHDRLTINRVSEMEWYAVEDPDNGSPMNFERGGGAMPVPGMFIKLLHRDPTTGFYTRLIKAGPGWKEHPLAHHPVFEEAYLLGGQFDYNYGSIRAGGYFFRPAGIRHGDFVAGEEEGFTFILRCDGDLVDWYTDNARVEMQGDPVNWGEGFPMSEPPVLIKPLRSKTAGDWEDPNYQ